MQLKDVFGPARPERYFGLLFWTPFWLLPVLSEKGVDLQQTIENIVAGIAVSAALEAIANLAGERRRYFYLIAGIVLWFGAAAFITYAVIDRGVINAFPLVDAGQYATMGTSDLTHVSRVGDVPPWLLASCLPFFALAFYWRKLGGPRRENYVALLLIVFLLPLPMKLAQCSWTRSCEAAKFTLPRLYPAKHYAPVAAFVAVADLLRFHAALKAPSFAHVAVTIKDAKRPFTLIVVVEESLNRNHMSLYGYCRNTTPKLDAANLFVFRDVVSMMPLTMFGVPRGLTVTKDSSTPDVTGPSLIQILNAGDFSTSWISNQVVTSAYTSNVFSLAQSAQHKIWLNVEAGPQRYNQADPLDEDLLAPLSKALAAKEPRKAIFLHMNGTHLPYTWDYPAGFMTAALAKAHPGRDADQDKTISEYDSAVLHGDSVIGHILEQLKQKGGDAALVMFSDHGEEVFDQIDWNGHVYPGATRNMLEIPFVVWLSPALRARRPELASALQNAIAKPMQNTDISAVVADVADLSLAGLDPARRPLTPQFRSTPRRSIDGDYDRDRNLGIQPTLPPVCPAHGM